LLVKQCQDDNAAICRSSAVSGGLALESDVTVILNCEKLLITSLGSRHEKTFVKDCELLDM